MIIFIVYKYINSINPSVACTVSYVYQYYPVFRVKLEFIHPTFSYLLLYSLVNNFSIFPALSARLRTMNKLYVLQSWHRVEHLHRSKEEEKFGTIFKIVYNFKLARIQLASNLVTFHARDKESNRIMYRNKHTGSIRLIISTVRSKNTRVTFHRV